MAVSRTIVSLHSGGKRPTHDVIGRSLQEHVGLIGFDVVYWILGSIITCPFVGL
jgi:hypothetical protein